MEFEYDPAKSASIKDKHGIDFEEAKALWKDENRLSLPLLTEIEPRFLMVGLIGEKMWTAGVHQARCGSSDHFRQAITQERGDAI